MTKRPYATVARFLTGILVSCALVAHGTTYGGVLAAQSFSEAELSAFQQLEDITKPETKEVQGGDGFFASMGTVLLVLAAIGLAVWAASEYDHGDHECVIDGVHIDPDSRECREAVERKEFESSFDDDFF